MAITLVFILFISFLERFCNSNKSRSLDACSSQLGSITINTFNQHFNTSTPQFHIQALGPDTRVTG